MQVAMMNDNDPARMTEIAERTALFRKTIGKILRAANSAVGRLFNRSSTNAPIDVGRNSPLQRRANTLAETGAFLGGPAAHFHAIGCNQLITLLESGLMPSIAFWI
jgi:hypothetical protein